jgi:hypothetical protein
MASHTFLAPGQRYTDTASSPWRVEYQLTILQIVRYPDGSTVVTYRCANGNDQSAPAEQLETAVAKGLIIPVIGLGHVAGC